MRLSSLLLSGFLLLPACAHKHEARTVNEVGRTENLVYNLQIDATRLIRGTGLGAVEAVTRLIEQDLSPYFKVEQRTSMDKNGARELAIVIADSPAPGYAVRARIEARPDDFCFVTLEAVRRGTPNTLDPAGVPEAVSLAPYSVHFGLAEARRNLASLRTPTRAALDPQRFDSLRKQATALAASGDDPPIDEATFARTPRPLERLDDGVRYYAPPADRSGGMRGQ